MSKEHGHFHWNELMTRDVEAAKSFYAETLGWHYNSMEMPDGGTYWVAMNGDKPVGGMFTMKGPKFENVPVGWFAYIEVDDVDARLEKVKAAGGNIMGAAFDVPMVGRIAIVQDKSGGHVGWITPAARDQAA